MASAWEEVIPLDEGLKGTLHKHYEDLEVYAKDAEKVKKGCMATIEKQFQGESAFGSSLKGLG